MPDRPGLRPRHVTPLPLTALHAVAAAGVAADVAAGVVVTGVTHDSRQVRPGDLYLALPGAVTHGARFAAAAVTAGAVAIVTDDDGVGLAGEVAIPVIRVADPRALLGDIAATVYGHPARDLLMLGVTGTNGKTTTTYLLEAGLRAAGHTTGIIGTVETRIGDERVASVRTTPEATDVHALLAVMRERGVTACAMEVSSHAMVFGRVDGVVFDVAGFTNLTQDHLDFHTDLDDYFAAKARLFTPEHTRRAVVVAGDHYGRRLAASPQVPTVTVSPAGHGGTGVPEGGAGRLLHDRRDEWRVERHGDLAFLAGPDGEKLELRVPLPGEFNVSNAALAVAMLLSAGVDGATAARGVAECPGVPGRMERVSAGSGGPGGAAPLAVVDFAHTPDAIDNVLRTLHPRGRLIVVVGAGGDRDREKRPLMGAAAARWADVVVVTDDNPRSEDAAAIRAAVVAGARAVPDARRAGEILEVGDRREAIRAALSRAHGPDDTVVVLGKGHEQGQEIAGVVHPFDDRDVLREELVRWSEESRA